MIRTRRFSFQRRGPKRLALRFSVNPLAGEWDAVEVRVDAVVIGTATREMCWQGVEYALFDGSVLRMWLESPPGSNPVLNVTRNGHPLPGSEGDPLHQVRGMVVMLWVFAAIEILVEVIVVMSIHRRNDPRQLVTDYWVTAIAVMVMLLGILAWRRSVVALVFACVLFAGQLFVYFALHPSWALFLRGCFRWSGSSGSCSARSARRWSWKPCDCRSGVRCRSGDLRRVGSGSGLQFSVFRGLRCRPAVGMGAEH